MITLFFFFGTRNSFNYKGCTIHTVDIGNETTVSWQGSDYNQHDAKTVLGAKRAITKSLKKKPSN